MHIYCKDCGTAIPASDVNLDTMAAKCTHCNAVFSIADSLGTRIDKKREEVSMPKGFTIENKGFELDITRKWFNSTFIFLLFFVIFWDGFLLFWFGAAIASGAWFMALFGSLHAALGIGLTYYVIAGFLNTSYITVTMQDLKIEHKPIPFPKKIIPIALIKQLYSKEHISHTKNGVNYSYQVHMISHDGHKKKLIKGLQTPEQALFIEQQIERFLRIKDEKISGEIGRT